MAYKGRRVKEGQYKKITAMSESEQALYTASFGLVLVWITGGLNRDANGDKAKGNIKGAKCPHGHKATARGAVNVARLFWDLFFTVMPTDDIRWWLADVCEASDTPDDKKKTRCWAQAARIARLYLTVRIAEDWNLGAEGHQDIGGFRMDVTRWALANGAALKGKGAMAALTQMWGSGENLAAAMTEAGKLGTMPAHGITSATLTSLIGDVRWNGPEPKGPTEGKGKLD